MWEYSFLFCETHFKTSCRTPPLDLLYNLAYHIKEGSCNSEWTDGLLHLNKHTSEK